MRTHAKVAAGCLASLFIYVLAAASAEPPALVPDMHKNVGEMQVRGAAFSDVIDKLRDATNQHIFVNWRPLAAYRVTTDLPVTLDLSRLPLDEALNRLLQHVGGAYVRLGYTIDLDTITITTAADLEKNTSTRVYDVRAAIKDGPDRAKNVDAIIRRVEGVDPLSWKESGGNIGSIYELGGQLVVTQAPEIQHLIAEELRDLVPADHGEGPQGVSK